MSHTFWRFVDDQINKIISFYLKIVIFTCLIVICYFIIDIMTLLYMYAAVQSKYGINLDEFIINIWKVIHGFFCSLILVKGLLKYNFFQKNYLCLMYSTCMLIALNISFFDDIIDLKNTGDSALIFIFISLIFLYLHKRRAQKNGWKLFY